MPSDPHVFDEEKLAFIFVPHGAPEPTEWLSSRPDNIKLPATFVPHERDDERASSSFDRPPPGQHLPGDGLAAASDPSEPWPPTGGATYDDRSSGMPGGMPIGANETSELTYGSNDPVAAYRSADAALATAASSYVSGGGAGPDAPTSAAVAGDATGADRPHADAGRAEDPTAPVPFVDDQGNPVLDRDGKPMLRPAGLDPHMFVERGLADRRATEELAHPGLEGSDLAPSALVTEHLAQFRHWGAWDAQRLGGKFHKEFVDYSTVAVGPYAAAAGIPRSDILSIQDADSLVKSGFPAKTEYDKANSHLPTRNSSNTDRGSLLSG